MANWNRIFLLLLSKSGILFGGILFGRKASRCSRRSTHGMEIGDLAGDILFHHIFSRLPIKSILRCRSVCKAWNRILGNPEFVRQHLNQQQDSHKLLIKMPFEKSYSVDYEEAVATRGRVVPSAMELNLPQDSCFPIMHIFGTCNGLVGISFGTDPRGSRPSTIKLLLWNPSTRESKSIPDPYPSILSFQIIGFAYDSNVDDYKIIRIIHTHVTCQVDIYSLRNNSWKMVRYGPHNGVDIKPKSNTDGKGLVVNGFLYWLVMCYDFSIPNSIMECCLRDYNFTQIPMPHDALDSRIKTDTMWDLIALGRCHLALFYFSRKEKFVVWTLKKNEERKWEKLMCLLPVSSPGDLDSLTMRPVRFTKDDDGKVVIIFLGFRGRESWRGEPEVKFGVYDTQKKSMEYVRVYGVENGGYCAETTYIESLVSPNMFGRGTGC